MTKSKKASGDHGRDSVEDEKEEEEEEDEDFDEDDSSDLEIEDTAEAGSTLMVVVKDSRSKAVRAHSLPNKSVKNTYNGCLCRLGGMGARQGGPKVRWRIRHSSIEEEGKEEAGGCNINGGDP